MNAILWLRSRRAGIRVTTALLALAWLTLGNATAQAQLTRAQAVTALLAPASGVPLDTTNSVVWSPFADFGFGAGFEGLLPAGATVSPFDSESGSALSVATRSYFFWIDDQPPALFVHEVRFVLVKADVANPTASNGGIAVVPQSWWPLVRLPNGTTLEYFRSSLERRSPNPPGAANPEGWIIGLGGRAVPIPPAPAALAAAGAPAGPAPASRACGLIVNGDPDPLTPSVMARFESDLVNHYGVPTNRLIKANHGNPATCADLEAAISNLCMLAPACDKIYLRFISHGSNDFFFMADGRLYDTNLCRKLQPLAAKGVPICLLIEACRSGTMLDANNWNFPAGSSIITAANTNLAWGHASPFNLVVGTNVVETNIVGGLLSHAFQKCLNDPRADSDRNGMVDDCEALAWVKLQKPCYIWIANGKRCYPAGPPAGEAGDDPDPQKRAVGNSPFATVMTVCNGTRSNATDFHLVYQGNITDGLRTRSTRALQDGTPVPQLGWTNPPAITYNPVTDETMVCWADTNSPIADPGYLNVTVVDPMRRLRPKLQFWTPTLVPPAAGARVPGRRAALRPADDGTAVAVRIVGGEPGGTEPPQAMLARARFAAAPVPDANFTPADPQVNQLPEIELATFTLFPNVGREFTVTPPPMPGAPLPTIIFETRSTWSQNSNGVIILDQFTLPLPPEDTTVLSYCPGVTTFLTVNPPGPGANNQWYKNGEAIPGANNSTIELRSLRFGDAAIYTGISRTAAETKRKYFDVSVEDLVPATINCPSNMTVECAGPGGTAVNFGAQAGDTCGNIVSFSANPSSGSMFPPGTTPVTVTVVDTGGHVTDCTFNVTVVDTTPPEIQCLSDRTFTAPSAIIFSFTPGAFDNCDPNPTITCAPPSGSTFPPETTTLVRCTARDSSGNQSECSFNVTVRRPGGSRLDLTRNGNALRVTWSDANGQLQQAGSATGTWTNVPNAVSPHDVTLNPQTAGQYFRLFFPDALPSAR